MNELYGTAQMAIASLKGAIYTLLKDQTQGLKNAQIGKMLGIHKGHKQHAGHIVRTLLEVMQAEGVVKQDEQSKLWTICTHIETDED